MKVEAIHLWATLHFARFFRARARFHFASAFRRSSLETVRTLRTALSNLSNSVLPGIFGAGNGFIQSPRQPFNSTVHPMRTYIQERCCKQVSRLRLGSSRCVRLQALDESAQIP